MGGGGACVCVLLCPKLNDMVNVQENTVEAVQQHTDLV